MDHIRQQCRERRRQRKSLQAYLGMLDDEVAKQDAIIAAPPKKLELHTKISQALPSAPPPDLLASNDDTLNEVFRNFEDVLRSHERGLGNGHIDNGHEVENELQKVDLLRNAPKYADSAVVSPGAETTQSSPSHWRETDQRKASEILDMVFGPTRSRSGSTSSISSLSTNSSSAVPETCGRCSKSTAPCTRSFRGFGLHWLPSATTSRASAGPQRHTEIRLPRAPLVAAPTRRV